MPSQPAASAPDPLVLGLDVTRGAWVAVALAGGRFHRALHARNVVEILDAFPGAAVVGIDIPIGYPSPGEPVRPADQAARALLPGRARSRVFPVPPREVLATESHASASELSRRLTGKGISRQAHALRGAILEVERLSPRPGQTWFEVHPELSFLAMACRSDEGTLRPGDTWAGIQHPKKTWNGVQDRVRVLAEQGIVIPGDLAEAGRVPVDDVLDAAAAAWSTERIRRGRARSLPEHPPGEPPVAIWY